MAKKDKAKAKAVDPVTVRLMETTLNHVQELFEKREDRFMQALRDSEKQTITLNFSVTLDLSDAAPVVDTTLRFKDKDKEQGMEVNKTFKASLTAQFDDPNQPKLPGVEPKQEDEGAE